MKFTISNSLILYKCEETEFYAFPNKQTHVTVFSGSFIKAFHTAAYFLNLWNPKGLQVHVASAFFWSQHSEHGWTWR